LPLTGTAGLKTGGIAAYKIAFGDGGADKH
jgi:hypothetical protein